MNQTTRRFLLVTAFAFTLANRGVLQAQEAVDPAVKTTAETLKGLFDELMAFKGEPEFHEMGFGAGGSYGSWLDRLKALDAGADGISLMRSGFRAVPMDYQRSGGQETRLTRQFREDFQAGFEQVL